MSREDVPRGNSSEFMESVVRDLRFALRSFRKRPAFLAVALLTLALGISATTVMFTVINGVLLKPLSYPTPERLFTLRENTEKYGALWVSYPDFLDCQQQSHTLNLAAWAYAGGMVTEPGDPQYVESRQISPELFSVLEIPLIRGRSFLPEENRIGATPVAVISHHLWQSKFGERADAVGSKLTFDGKSYTITGIAPARFQLDGEPDVFTPLGQSTEPKMQNREASSLHVFGRLHPDATAASAQAELSQIAGNLARSYPASNAGRSFSIQPLLQELVGSVSSILWLLLGAVGLLLLIACANVASLLLTRAVSREREFAVQVALGAGRGRIIRQCLTESALLGLAGGTLGVLLAGAAMRPFLLFWPSNLPRIEEIHLDWHVLIFALILSLVSAMLFGLAPALRAPTRNLERALRAGARTMSSSRRLHSAFVVSQVALAVLLLISAGMLGRTVLRLSSLDPGLELKNVLVSHLAFSPGALTQPAQTRAAWQQLIDNARQVPGVRYVALTDIVPMRQSLDEVGYWTSEAQPAPNEMPLALESIVTPDYLKVMGIPLRAGRFFTDDDRVGSNPVSVIDEVLARYAFKGQDPIGKRLYIQGLGPTQIIGIVGHVRHWGLARDDQAKVRAEVYQPLASLPDRMTGFFSSFLSITVRTDVAPLNISEVLQGKMRSVAGTPVMYDIRTMEQLASASLVRERFLVLLFSVFAGLALLLACVGVYGVMAYLTSQRIPEIGVRMALGANPSNILQLVLKQSLGMVLIGAGLGVLAALAAGRLLLHLVDGMRPTEPLTVAAMVTLLIAAALLASFVPARRASRLNAVQALRGE
jgi:predicted permease